MTLPRRRFLQLAAAALPGLPDVALAQTYPSRTVRIIVATAAGGTTDLAARLIAQSLSDKLGQAFVVENRTGGSNNIGTEAAAHAPPDGYTLFMANSVNAINTSMYSNLSFNFSTDLIPVAVAMKSVLVLQVHPSVPVKTLPEFIAYAKANPGKINMGSGGKGSTGAMCGELFQMMAGVKFQHVPYRGKSLAMADLIGGQVQMVVATVGSSIQYIKAGQVRAIAVTSAKRAPMHCPTAADRGDAAGLRGDLVERADGAEGHAGARSSTSSTARSTRASPIPGSSSASSQSAGRQRLTRPLRSAASSRSTPRNGRRWSRRPGQG